MHPLRIQSPRLELIEVIPLLAEANLNDINELARLVEARIPATWPPEHWEPAAIQWLIDKAREHPDERGWFAWHVVLKSDAVAHATRAR